MKRTGEPVVSPDGPTTRFKCLVIQLKGENSKLHMEEVLAWLKLYL